jgi:O-antigen/teichoic acid export membrane protein
VIDAGGQGKPRRPAEASGARVVRNTIVNGLASAAGLFVTLLLTPFMLHRLGADAYGVWVLALTLTFSAGYLSLTDLGLQQAAVRFIADARRTWDEAGITGIYSTTFAIFVAVALPVALLLIALGPSLVGIFSLKPSLHHAAGISFQLIGAQILFDLPAMAFRAVLEGAQRFIAIRLIDLFRVVAMAISIVVLLSAGNGIVALAAASTVVSLAAALAFAAIVTATEPSARLRLRAVTRARIRQLMGFGGALFVLRIVSVMYRQMDKLIIGVALTTAAVTQYEIANKVYAAMVVLFTISSSALLPAAAFMRLDRARMRELFLRGTSYSVALLLPVMVAVVVYAHDLIVGWVGQAYASSAGLVRILFLWLALGTFDVVGTTILIALGRLRRIVKLSVIWVVTNLLLSIALVGPFGVAGVIWATSITYLPLLVAYTSMCLREFDISLGSWARRVVVPNAPGLLVQVPLSIVLLLVVSHLPRLLGVGIAGGVSVAASIATYMLVGLNASERHDLLRTLAHAAGLGSRRLADRAPVSS